MYSLILASCCGVAFSPAASITFVISQKVLSLAGSPLTALNTLIAESTFGEAATAGAAARHSATRVTTTRFILGLLRIDVVENAITRIFRRCRRMGRTGTQRRAAAPRVGRCCPILTCSDDLSC